MNETEEFDDNGTTPNPLLNPWSPDAINMLAQMQRVLRIAWRACENLEEQLLAHGLTQEQVDEIKRSLA